MTQQLPQFIHRVVDRLRSIDGIAAIAQLKALPADEQDAIATRFLTKKLDSAIPKERSLKNTLKSSNSLST
jgi:hypothetical protein